MNTSEAEGGNQRKTPKSLTITKTRKGGGE